MDPIANLKEQREIVKRMQQREDKYDYYKANPIESEIYNRDQAHDGLRLAELVDALDGWISRGGFSPWTKQPS